MCKSSSIIQDKQFDESKSSKSIVVSWLRYKDDFWLKLTLSIKGSMTKNLSSAYDGKLHFLNFIG